MVRWAIAMVLVVGCDAGTKPTKPEQPAVKGGDVPVVTDAADPIAADAAAPVADAAALPHGMKAVTMPVPPGPYVINFECSHSNMPFGEGGSRRFSTFDLGKQTITSFSFAWTENHPRVPPKEPPAKVKKLGEAHRAKLEAAVAKVLAGGPYRAEYPVPEGEPCTLTIFAPNNVEAFSIEKAYQKENDEVNALIAAFAP